MIAHLDAALAYARRGWHVFPVEPRGKRPLGSLVAHGKDDASLDEATITRWWTARPDANVGIACEPSGLVVLDVDIADGKQGEASLAEIDHLLPPTLCARTGSGGLHAIYARPPGVEPPQRIGFRPGLDLIGKGYFVAAPSVHASGALYTWVEPSNAIAALPPVLGDATAAPRPASSSASAHDAARIPSGQRNGALTSIAGSMRHRGMSEAAIVAALLVANQEQCDPPLGEDEVRTIAASVMRYEPGADVAASAGNRAFFDRLMPRRDATGTFAEALATALADVRALLSAPACDGAVAPLFEPAPGLFAREFAPTPWLVRDLVTDGGTLLLAGEPKTSKTWALTEIAIAVATGTSAFGTFATGAPRTVAYFYAEDLARQVRNRFRALSAGRNLRPEDAVRNIHVQPRGRFLDVLRDEDLALIVASCRRIGRVDLPILEPLRDLHSGEEDKSDSMGPVMRRLRVLGEILKCTIGVAHHSKKDANGNRGGQKARGSSAIHGAIDSGIYLSDLKGDGRAEFINRVESEVKGAKAAGRFGLTLRIVDDAGGEAIRATWIADLATSPKDTGPALSDPLVADLADALWQSPDRRQTLGVLRKGRGSRTLVDAAVEFMRETGLIREIRKGQKHCGYELTASGVRFAEGAGAVSIGGAS